ncbi:MAG: TonB-dependent receptor [Cyclobacteriaceae bacterium]|nr:TonB-dependent receptor [Cyclobacteriaceae bacterium]
MAPKDTLGSQVAWEYQLDEVLISSQSEDPFNTNARFYKADPLSSGDEVMENLVGVWAIKRGSYAYEPMMRGLSGGQINVSIDEMRILGACTDKMDPVTAYVEPNNLASLNISHGAGGYTAGSTVGGAYDMQIKKPVINEADPWHSAVGYRYLSASNGLEALFNTAYGMDKLAFRAGATYRKASDYRAGGGEEIDFSAYNKVNYSTSISYLPGKNDLLNFSAIGDYAWQVGYPALPMDVGNADAKIFGLSYDKWLHHGKMDQLTAKVYYNRISHRMDDSRREVALRMDMPGHTYTYGGFAKGLYTWNKRVSGQMKIDGHATFAHAEMTMHFEDAKPMFMLTWPDVHRKVLGFQNQTTYRAGDGFTLNAGFRMEKNAIAIQSELGERQLSVFAFGEANRGELLFNANAGVEKELASNLNSGVLVSFGQRMPTEGEQYGFYLFNAYDGYDYIGRPDLRSEQSLQAELFSQYRGEVIRLKVTGYYYHFHRYIMGVANAELSPMTIGANGVKVYKNMDEARLAGVEAQFELKIHKFKLLNQLKFTYGELKDGTPLPLMPPLKNMMELHYQTNSQWLFNLGMEAAAWQNRINRAFGEQKTPGYAIANLMLGKAFSVDRLAAKVSLSVENIFDNRYHEHLDWGGIPRPGRNISLGFLLDF